MAGISARCVVDDPARPDGLLMFYEGQSREGRHSIGLASGSPDGLHWTRLSNRPVFEPSEEEGSWDGAAVSRPWIVPLEDGSARLYYLGKSKEGAQAIGAAESEGTDWTRWKRL